ncbi:M23 family metallopeptidase [Rhizorhapis sp. SPR117]|uniref:M23 family metallopeptidase n=1 Tax=Rhizorhapis sp. SPR117 TaxID=2912611 RepID=UPI001F228FD1|nr:M23 family metallopeptidase [Rhizorhapis sp. SPR117]
MFNNDVGVLGLLARVGRFFPEREIFLRSDGSVRFLKISTRLQIAVAGTVVLAVLAWVVATVFMLIGQYDMARDRAALDQQKAAVASSAKTVRSYRASVDEITDDLEQRQESLEELVKSHFGDALDDGKLVGKDNSTARGPEKGDALEAKTSKISAALPEAGTLRRIETQQIAFARRLTHAVALRTAKVEAAIRSFGLNPSTLVRQTRSAEGGPFIPYKGADVNGTEEHFDTLGTALHRLDALEKGLLAIPSGRPTSVVMLSSGFGYRRDPFNGHGAFHAGLDFRGAYGQPILAAADGKVSFVGQRSGYGNVVEITHGRGIMTRYAHVSGFNSKVGQKVVRGQQVARMGSTGRSTGTHLHFEVRLNGQPINPRRFLEAKADVLEIQKIAKQRFGDAGNRG